MTTMVTPRQIAFLKRLTDERDTTQVESLLNVTRRQAVDGTLTARTASQLIDRLLALPRKQDNEQDAPAEAEPGFYVRGDDAFKVQKNKAGTHTYALVWSGSSWDYSPGTGRSLAGLTPMTAEQAAALGLASGRCIACLRTLGGETLTAKVSALIGYGEICADHNGWFYPKGAKAQREYIDARTLEEYEDADADLVDHS
jgi:hypothetical protein